MSLINLQKLVLNKKSIFNHGRILTESEKSKIKLKMLELYGKPLTKSEKRRNKILKIITKI